MEKHMFFRRKRKNQPDKLQENSDNTLNTVTKLAHMPETHLEQYLAYYVSRLKPGYAVLVTGDWGTGKSFQVKHALPDEQAHYISLFGLNTPQDIEAQVFAKMFPNRASMKNFARQADLINVELPIIGALGTNGLASALVNVLIKNEVDSSKPLIFDDLERSSVEINVLLGLINHYVEQNDCRVIVIAHDAKIVEGFKETKEKVFGQTLHIEPNTEAAFSDFKSIFSVEDNEILTDDLMNEVLSVFKESEATSLRILRHVVEDCKRLTKTLEERHQKHHMAMVELIRLFSALAIEVRSNRLDETALKNRQEAVVGYRLRSVRGENEQTDNFSIGRVASKYASIDVTSTLLNDQVLSEMLIEGRFVSAHIQDSLNASAYFLEQEAAAPWQIVSNFDKLDDVDVEEAVKKMLEQFVKREVTESGEFLHMVALMMMMASKELTKKTVSQISGDAKTYIDELLRNGRLPPRTAGPMWFEDFKDSYAHVSYWVTDSYKVEFREIFEYLIEARKKALENTYPERIPPLLEVVRTDGRKFFEKVCHTQTGTVEYDDIPILAHIPIKDFVDAWLASPKTGWYWIANALNERNKATSHYPSLKPEAAWYPKIAEELERRAKEETGLAYLRIIRATEQMGFPPTCSPKP